MKVGICLLCRYNSSRLPGKILKEIAEEVSLLDYIHKQISGINGIDDVVVCTSEEKTDDVIADYCKTKGYHCHRGDLNNVAKRVIDCAEDNHWDYFFRINGDNLFVDRDLISRLSKDCKNNDFTLYSNVPGRTYPYGMSIECLNLSLYKEAYAKFYNDANYTEHVTLYLYENEVDKIKAYKNTTYPILKGYKLAVDTPEDFLKAKSIVSFIDNTNIGLADVSHAIEKYERHD